MCVCLVVIEFVMLSIFWAGWVVVSAAFFVSRGSEHVEYPENNFKLGGNLTEWHSTGLFSGSVPSLACFFSISSIFFQQEACVYVWLSLVLSCFVHFLGWLGGCAKWHSTGLSPGSVPSLAFFLSISSIFFSARSMYLCFVGCGLWDSAWQMANLPDRSKCINYRKILWFWNAMIYLHYCVCDPWCKSLHAVRRFFPEKSPGKIRKTQKDSKVFWCSLGICRGRMAPLTLHPMWKKCTRPSAIQACAEPMVPNTCAEEPMVKTNDFDSGERNCNLGYLFPPVVTHREVSWKGGGLGCERTCGTPLKIIRWKAPEIISWILDDIWGGGVLEIISRYLHLRTWNIAKVNPPWK